MKLLNTLIDKLQATFPPNRVVVILTPLVFMPAAGGITAWVATHFPGYQLSEGLVIGLAAAAALGGLQLANKWLDEWQRGEPIHVGPDVDQALNELADGPDAQAFYASLGTLKGVGDALADLRAKVESGQMVAAEAIPALDSIGGVIENFLHAHIAPDPTPPVASPPAETVPPAAPQPAE